MAEIFNGFTVTESNGSLTQLPSVTIKNSLGQICARIYSKKGKVLNRVRKHLLSDERAQLIDQMTRTGVPNDVIQDILTPRRIL